MSTQNHRGYDDSGDRLGIGDDVGQAKRHKARCKALWPPERNKTQEERARKSAMRNRADSGGTSLAAPDLYRDGRFIGRRNPSPLIMRTA